ncbi:MAG: ketol-acid reductoisomerase [Hydrogenophilaceae bacterium]|jgi:ketol-acid reductoisomerase|nr:ketol-acid reductoisomerase [Hydrogenophilaceae bacterium]
MKVFYERDADLARIKQKRVAIVGFGSQGAAHALNLRDSGAADLVVALKSGSASAAKAHAAGLRVVSVREAASWADIVMLLAPDETHEEIYAAEIAPAMQAGKMLLFCHGFSVHFGFVVPPSDVDVAMVAPKGPGPAVRAAYEKGGGLPCIVAVHQDASGEALQTALAYGAAIGCGRAGMIETTFKAECECDLFGEQVVLCGGLAELVRAAFETLVEAGYPPEMAYFECLHEAKLTADLMHAQGIAGMNLKISNTAEYGEYVVGPRIITAATRAEMKRVLEDVRSGRFAQAWMAEHRAGGVNFKAMRAKAAEHPIEKIGAEVRRLQP